MPTANRLHPAGRNGQVDGALAITAKAVIVTLAFVAAGPVLVGENLHPFDNRRVFHWDRSHAGQDACPEKDRCGAV